MRLPAGPARFLKTQYIVAALIAALLALSSSTGFAWASKNVTLVVDGSAKSVATERDTVASLLEEAGVDVRQGDLVSPASSARLEDGAVVVVRHAVPVTLKLGEESISLKVLGRTVADALVMAGLDPTAGMDTIPAVDAPLESGMVVTAVDVFIRLVEEQAVLPYSTTVQGDPNVPLGQRTVVRQGADGSAIRVWQVLVTGGVEGPRSLKLQKVITEPVGELVVIGTKQPFHQVIAAKARARAAIPAPPLSGTTRLMESTAYTPFECGKDATWVAAKKRQYRIPDGWGLIAVDPKVIPLGTKMFVEGYGYAVACDTGGVIHGNIIDVCYWGADLTAPAGIASRSQRDAAKAASGRWGRRHNVRVTLLGK